MADEPNLLSMFLPALGTLASLLALVGCCVLLLWLARQYWRWRIGRWCRDRRFELLGFRFTWFWERSYPFWQSDYRTSFRIEVRDRDGFEREGCLVFGNFWDPFGLEAEVTWD